MTCHIEDVFFIAMLHSPILISELEFFEHRKLQESMDGGVNADFYSNGEKYTITANIF